VSLSAASPEIAAGSPPRPPACQSKQHKQPQPRLARRGRATFGAFCSDIRQLLDQLGLGAVLVVGFSGGGPYAAACAATMPERVSALVLLAGERVDSGARALPACLAWLACLACLPCLPGSLLCRCWWTPRWTARLRPAPPQA
jgi:pimeloyl-ACP methyl ester carboxylesterase